MPAPVDRRFVLRLLGAGAGLTALSACGGGGGGNVGAAAGGGSASGGGGGSSSSLVLVPNDWDFFAGMPYRVAFLVADNAHNGAPVALDSPLTLRISTTGAPPGPPIPTVIHANGPEAAYALATYTFPVPGTYEVTASFKGQTLSLPLPVTAPSASVTPTVGQQMTSVPTPTTADHMGVNPICTAQPPCPFHAVSLDAALAAHQPVALIFATPALCQSRFCGPVLANLAAVSGPWRSRVTFIHSEIYTDLTGQRGTPTVLAYHLQHEPLLLLAGADGIVRERIDNGYDRAEATSALERLVSS